MRLLRAIAALIALTLPARAGWAADGYFTTSDGVRLHYIEQGPREPGAAAGPSARTIVLVPGWTMPAWIFGAQIADLSRHYRVIALDPRSQGDSDIAPDGHGPARRGQDIAELLRHIALQPVVLLGWSLGVLDALAYIHANGDQRVAGLVLVDNSVGEDPPPSGGGHPLGRRGKPLTREAAMRQFVRGMFRHPQPAAYIDRLTSTCLRTPPDVAEALLSYPVPRSYWKEAVYSTTHPVLYLVTPHLSGQAQNLQRHHPAAESLVLPDVGHAMFVDDPGRFDRLVEDFIRRRIWP